MGSEMCIRDSLKLERRQIICISYSSADFLFCESDSELLILVRSQKQTLFVQIEIGFLLCETDAEMVPVPYVCLLVGFYSSSARFLNMENSSQRRLLLLGLAPRGVRFARPWTQPFKPALTDSSLAAKRRAEALHSVFFQPSIRAHHDDLHAGGATAVCVSQRRSHERRSLRALLSLVAKSAPASTGSYL